MKETCCEIKVSQIENGYTLEITGGGMKDNIENCCGCCGSKK